MTDIILTPNSAFPWFSRNNIHVKGFLFDNNDKFIQAEDLILYFSEIRNETDFEKRLKTANGNFAAVVQSGEKLYVSVDCLRSIPLFYALDHDSGRILISDTADEIRNKLNISELSEKLEKEFVNTGYMTGQDTLIENIKQIDSGEYIIFDKRENTLSTKYYNYFFEKSYKPIPSGNYSQMKAVSDRVYQRLIQSVNGKTIVIPLSGGYDSRYIAAALKDLNYEKVICYSYGKKSSYEAGVSQAVARQLGFEWHFAEYTDDIFQSYPDQEVLSYYRQAHNFVSIPHYQDFPAVRYLKKNQLIPDDSVIVPGHSGDLLRGDFILHLLHTLSDDPIENADIFQLIMNWHFNLHGLPPDKEQERYIQKIQHYFKDAKISEYRNMFDLFDSWDIANRQSKLIVNSVRVYEYFGYEWRLPLWESEMFKFWYGLPVEQRFLYNDFLSDVYFKKYDIDFKKWKESTSQNIVSKAKQIMPEKMKVLLKKKFSGFADVNNLNTRMQKKMRDLNMDPKQAVNYKRNYISSLWTLNLIKSELNK